MMPPRKQWQDRNGTVLMKFGRRQETSHQSVVYSHDWILLKKTCEFLLFRREVNPLVSHSGPSPLLLHPGSLLPSVLGRS